MYAILSSLVYVGQVAFRGHRFPSQQQTENKTNYSAKNRVWIIVDRESDRNTFIKAALRDSATNVFASIQSSQSAARTTSALQSWGYALDTVKSK